MRPQDPNGGGNHRKNLMQSLDGSLKRLGTDYIDLLWVHAWDFMTPIDEVMRGLDDVVRVVEEHQIGQGRVDRVREGERDGERRRDHDPLPEAGAHADELGVRRGRRSAGETQAQSGEDDGEGGGEPPSVAEARHGPIRPRPRETTVKRRRSCDFTVA